MPFCVILSSNLHYSVELPRVFDTLVETTGRYVLKYGYYDGLDLNYTENGQQDSQLSTTC
jgi:hypothetical protein